MNRIAAVFLLLSLAAATAGYASEAPQQAPFDGRRDFRIAVLPIENLTGTTVPLKDIRRALTRKLRALGKQVVGDEELERCLALHRIRYTGGVDSRMAQALRDEVAADAVLVTSLETYIPGNFPKISLTCRLVSTEHMPAIIWMETVGRSGDEAPGILDLGLIHDLQTLQDEALRRLVISLGRSLARRTTSVSAGWRDSVFRPKFFFAGGAEAAGERIVAVIPFFNKSKRKNANQIMLLHFVRQLWGVGAVRVVEPGFVRERMLASRITMKDGFTYRNMDLIAGDMKMDVFLSGKVYEYLEGGGEPSIDFSALAIENKGRKVLWASNSYNKGDDGVYFFDVGRVATTNVMAEKMVHAIVVRMFADGR